MSPTYSINKESQFLEGQWSVHSLVSVKLITVTGLEGSFLRAFWRHNRPESRCNRALRTKWSLSYSAAMGFCVLNPYVNLQQTLLYLNDWFKDCLLSLRSVHYFMCFLQFEQRLDLFWITHPPTIQFELLDLLGPWSWDAHLDPNPHHTIIWVKCLFISLIPPYFSNSIAKNIPFDLMYHSNQTRKASEAALVCLFPF